MYSALSETPPNDNTLRYPAGADSIFVDDENWQGGGLVLDAATGRYQSSDTALNPESASLRGFARETGGQFVLGQNAPEPFRAETTIPFTLTNGADVRLEFFDPAGRKVASVVRKGLSAGKQQIHLNLFGLDLPAGSYSYQLQVTSQFGTFRQRRTMTVSH